MTSNHAAFMLVLSNKSNIIIICYLRLFEICGQQSASPLETLGLKR